MKFTKAKIIAAGVILAGICMITPQQLRAEVPEAQMDGVMGQSIKEEMQDTQIPTTDIQNDGLLSTYAMPQLLGASKAASGYTQDFLDSSFTSKVDYTSVTYYHKSDYEDAQLLNGIDVSWWQAKNKKTTSLDWNKIHNAGIDFAFVRVASRDTSDGSIYEDTAADSHIQAALKNKVNVGLYIFSQALTEKEAQEEANYVLNLVKKYKWKVTLPIVIDREKGSHNRLTAGKLSKTKETAVCQAFADTITKAGYQAAVYASYGWIKPYIDTDSLENCGIWIARYNYTTTSNAKRGEPYADAAYDYEFWQYSSVAKVKGYTGNLDVNFWYKDTSAKTGGLKATVGDAFDPVKLSWSKAEDGVTGYRVYRYDEAQKKYVYVKQTTAKSYTDTDVESGKSYQYKVRCYWTIGGTNYYGTYSSAVTATIPPAKVTGVKLEKRSSQYLTLKWDKISGASGYRVYKYNSSKKTYESVATISGGATTSYKVTGLKDATEYKFKVKAYKKTDVETVWGSASSEYKTCTTPLKVKNLKLSTKSSAVTLKWGKTNGAAGYEIYRYNRKTKKYDKVTTIKSGTTVSYTDKNLKKGTTYQYKVRAYKKYENSTLYGVCSTITKIKVK